MWPARPELTPGAAGYGAPTARALRAPPPPTLPPRSSGLQRRGPCVAPAAPPRPPTRAPLIPPPPLRPPPSRRSFPYVGLLEIWKPAGVDDNGNATDPQLFGYCSGSFVREDVLLTAAHCVHGAPDGGFWIADAGGPPRSLGSAFGAPGARSAASALCAVPAPAHAAEWPAAPVLP